MTARSSISFHGAAGTVTGSKYLVRMAGRRVLVDCGMFQGTKPIRSRNWRALPFDPGALDAAVLTHAHLDHSGMLPVLHRDGYDGPVYCTESTAALVEVLLPDSGRIHEEDARYANRHGFSRHDPALPLYSEDEAKDCLRLLRPVPFDATCEVARGVAVRFRRAGHILGASWVQLEAAGHRLTFSGDLGRPEDIIMHSPAPLEATDYLVLESTYGNLKHDTTPPETVLADAINRTSARQGVVLIPAFAVGRAQQMLYYLWHLKQSGAVRDIPVFLDSPMAVNATEIFCAHPDDHRLTRRQAEVVFSVARYINTVDESKALNRLRQPAIILSASGMATGGRILHHLKAHIGNPLNTVLFTGYQAEGTRGEAMLAGASTVKIHGDPYPVRAEIGELPGLSAHADAEELLQWVAAAPAAPYRTFVTHGEPAASAALCQRLTSELDWRAETPALGDQIALEFE